MSQLARIMPSSSDLKFGALGALAFWLPDVMIHLTAGQNFRSFHIWLLTFLMPLTALAVYTVVRLVSNIKNAPYGVAMIIAVWLTGGFFLTLSATVNGGGFANGLRNGFLGTALMTFPLFTCVGATYDGSLFALIIANIGAILILAGRKLMQD